MQFVISELAARGLLLVSVKQSSAIFDLKFAFYKEGKNELKAKHWVSCHH